MANLFRLLPDSRGRLPLTDSGIVTNNAEEIYEAEFWPATAQVQTAVLTSLEVGSPALDPVFATQGQAISLTPLAVASPALDPVFAAQGHAISLTPLAVSSPALASVVATTVGPGGLALDIDFTTGALDPRINFTRASAATYYNSAGLVTASSSGAARFDYDPVTRQPRGLLIEEQRTNYALNSEAFNGGAWNPVSTSVTADATTAPDGTTTADRLTATSTVTVDAIIYQATAVPTAGTAVFMGVFYAKKNVGDWVVLRPQCGGILPYAWFNLTTGAVGTVQAGIVGARIENVGNGWYRISAGLAGANGGTRFYSIGLADADNTTACTSGNSAYIWGAQVEEGSFVTSYIPTTSAAVTRAGDTAVMTGTNFSSWYTQSAGTFVTDFDIIDTSGQNSHPIFCAYGSSPPDEVLEAYFSWDAAGGAGITSGGVGQASFTFAPIPTNAPTKIGIAYTTNDFAGCMNGGVVSADSAGTPPALVELRFHQNRFAAPMAGHHRRLQFFNTRKTNAELQAITALPISSLDLDFMGGVLDPRITYTRTSSGTYYDVTGLIKTAATGVPRFEFDPASKEPVGLLVEGSTTNLCLRSNAFENAAWGKSGPVTATPNQIVGPDGTMSGCLMTATATGTWASVYSAAIATPAQRTWTRSIYAKKGTSNWISVGAFDGAYYAAWFDLSTGSVGVIEAGIDAAEIQNVGNGWYRCSVRRYSDAACAFANIEIGFGDANGIHNNTAGQTVYYYGTQFENSAAATSYIETAAAPVARAADLLSMVGANFSSWYNPAEGTFVVDYDTFADGVVVASAAAPDQSNFHNLVVSGGIRAVTCSQGAFVRNQAVGPYFRRQRAKHALAYKLNDFADSAYGAPVVQDTAGALPTGIDQFWLGNFIDTQNSLKGHLRRVQYFGVRKTDAELRALTVVPVLDIDFTLGTIDPRLTFTRNSAATYYDVNGLLTTATLQRPRFDYDPATLKPRGLLLEGQRSNFLTYSNDFSNAAWTKGAGSVIIGQDAVGPDGTANSAWSVTVGNAGPGIYQPYGGGTTLGSIWMRAKSGTPQIYLELGMGVSSTLITLTTKWQRYSVSGTTTYFEFRTDYPSPIPDVTIEVYGAQVEVGAFATSYIPTTTFGATRAGDRAQMTGTNFSSWYNQSEGTFVISSRHKGYASPNSIIFYTQGTDLYNANYHYIVPPASPGWQTNADGDVVHWSGNAVPPLPTVAVGSLIKFASAYKLNDYGDSCNGSVAGVDTDGVLPSGVANLALGTDWGGSGPISGWLERVTYYSVRRSNADLPVLTAVAPDIFTALALESLTLPTITVFAKHTVALTGLATGSPALPAVPVTVRMSVALTALATAVPALPTVTVLQVQFLSLANLATAPPVLPTVAAQQKTTVALAPLAVGSPALATLATVQAIPVALTAFASASPTLGTVSTTQIHALAIAGLATASPALATLAASQRHTAVLAALATTSLTLPTVTAAQSYAVAITALGTSSPTLGTVIAGQVHSVAAQALGVSALTLPTLTVTTAAFQFTVVLTALATTAPTLPTVVSGQGHLAGLTAFTTASPALGTVTATQKQTVALTALATAAPVLPAYTVAAYLAVALTPLAVSSPTLPTLVTTQILAVGLTPLAVASPALGTLTATQRHTASLTPLAVGSPALATVAATQAQALVLTALAPASPTLPVLAISQARVIVVAPLAVASPALGALTAVQAHAAILTPLATASPSLANVVAAQSHVISLAAFTTTSPALSALTITQRAVVVLTALATASPTLPEFSSGLQGLLIGSPTLPVVTATQRHAVAVTALALSAPALSLLTAAQRQAVALTALASAAPALPVLTAAQRQAVQIAALATAAPVLPAVIASQRHAAQLVALAVTEPALSTLVVTQAQVAALTPLAVQSPLLPAFNAVQAHAIRLSPFEALGPSLPAYLPVLVKHIELAPLDVEPPVLGALVAVQVQYIALIALAIDPPALPTVITSQEQGARLVALALAAPALPQYIANSGVHYQPVVVLGSAIRLTVRGIDQQFSVRGRSERTSLRGTDG